MDALSVAPFTQQLQDRLRIVKSSVTQSFAKAVEKALPPSTMKGYHPIVQAAWLETDSLPHLVGVLDNGVVCILNGSSLQKCYLFFDKDEREAKPTKNVVAAIAVTKWTSAKPPIVVRHVMASILDDHVVLFAVSDLNKVDQPVTRNNVVKVATIPSDGEWTSANLLFNPIGDRLVVFLNGPSRTSVIVVDVRDVEGVITPKILQGWVELPPDEVLAVHFLDNKALCWTTRAGIVYAGVNVERAISASLGCRVAAASFVKGTVTSFSVEEPAAIFPDSGLCYAAMLCVAFEGTILHTFGLSIQRAKRDKEGRVLLADGLTLALLSGATTQEYRTRSMVAATQFGERLLFLILETGAVLVYHAQTLECLHHFPFLRRSKQVDQPLALCVREQHPHVCVLEGENFFHLKRSL